MDNREEALDAAISARLRALPVPAGLKERILAQRPIPAEVPAPRFRAAARWAGALAIVGILVVAAWPAGAPFRPSFNGYEQELVTQIVSGEATRLAFTSAETAPLKEWLARHGAPSAIDVPAGAGRRPAIGCRTFVWNGKPVSQICFALEDGKIVHLFVIGRERWNAAPPEGRPQFTSHGAWTLASWREAGATYILAGEGNRADLEKLLL